MLRPFKDFLDDKYSVIHVVYGIVAALTEPVSATLVFIAYQYYEREPSSKKRGDFVEYGVGLVAGLLVRLLARLVVGIHVFH